MAVAVGGAVAAGSVGVAGGTVGDGPAPDEQADTVSAAAAATRSAFASTAVIRRRLLG